MKFKPVPDNIRCATIDAKYIVIAQKETPNGSYRAYVPDSDYIYDHVIMPALEDCATITYCSPRLQRAESAQYCVKFVKICGR